MLHDEALIEFLAESHENLDQLDRDFVALEADPTARDRIAAIFRTIHTIKGSAGFLGFSRLEALTHGGESLLVLLREESLTLTPAITSALLAMVDRVRAMLRAVESSGKEGDTPYEDVLATLKSLRSARPASPAAVANPAAVASPASLAAKVLPAPVFTVAPEADIPVMASRAPEPKPLVSREPQPTSSKAAPSQLPRAMAAPSNHPPAKAPVAPKEEPTSSNGAAADSTVRVDVGLLDKLMNLVGELVLARNQLVQFGATIEDATFVASSQRLNHITTELQEHVMKTRMQPIGNVWAKLPRVVRDLAITCGKQTRIEMFGKDTELDRTILEAIKDPLTHIVRNAVDHGIERPEDRAARGKPRTGTLTLRAFHEGGQVNIEVSDDGAGLRLDAIRSKAIERNLITAERAARLTSHELTQLVFEPGFSTAAQVTNVSGRGVGMDVVKTNIEKIGGTVDLISEAGVGTTLRIKIPLTLAIVPALIIASGGQRYAIPQVNLLELVRLERAQGKTAIERIHGAPVCRLRGRLLPLVYLSEQLNPRARGSAASAELREAEAHGAPTNIVVLQADDRQFGLVVDEVRDTEEIVVKPLGKELKGINIFQGATIMGDGRVALILDILGLVQHSGAVGRTRERSRADAARRASPVAEPTPTEKRQALLLFTVGRGDVMALPLSMVARIEEFPRDRLERTGTRKVIQYRGEILPLIALSDALDARGGEESASVQVIVYTENGRSVGFVVGGILDVVEDAVQVERSTARRGVLGAAVVQGRVTDVLDVAGVIAANHPMFFEGRAA